VTDPTQPEEPRRTAERRVDVMGTDAHVIVVAGDAPQLADLAISRLQQLEARWSRFLPSSEISRLNARRGAAVKVAPETFELISHALEAWRMTGGRFDLTVLADLCAEGYNRSFELLGGPEPSSPDQRMRTDGRTRSSSRPSRAAAPDIELDRIVGTVRLGPNTVIDAGGIGKGFAADLVVEELISNGARGALVNVGGDLQVEGVPPAGESWVVAIADPLNRGCELGNISLANGAVASSSRTKRVWIGPDGRSHHHLIDPRTGRSAATGVAGATVVAAHGWSAEVLAKAAFLAGPIDGPQLIADSGAAGILVGDDGALHPAGNVEDFLPPGTRAVH